MSNVILPDYIFGMLIFILWGTLTICIGQLIKDADENKKDRPKKIKNLIFYYRRSDWFLTFLGAIMLIIAIYFFGGISNLNKLVANLPTSSEKDTYYGLVLSFEGLAISLAIITLNFLKDVQDEVLARVRQTEITNRLENIENELKTLIS
ncbi:MAG: hypothetical protein ABSB80_12065 [Methanoregula sp.]